MELIISQSQTNQNKSMFFVLMAIISMMCSLVNVYGTSLIFVLPFFYLCFMCGYLSLLSFSIGLLAGIFVFHVPIETLFIVLLSFAVLQMCQLLKFIKATHIPYILTLISGVLYAYTQTYLLTALLLTILTYVNMNIMTSLPPLFIHNQSYLLTHERMKSLAVLVLICIIGLIPYSNELTFILMRVFILVMIYHQFTDDLLPALFYASMYILLINIHYKDDILSMIVPLFFFYMFPLKSKYALTSLYLVSHIILPFFIEFHYMNEGIVIIVSAIIFLLIPISSKKMVLSSTYEEVTTRAQITKQVESFCSLFEQITSLFNVTPVHNYKLEYIGYIYEDLCQDCPSHHTCFNKQLGPNRLVKLMNKGLKLKFTSDDINFINHYCLKPEKYNQIVEEYKKDYSKVNRKQNEFTTMKKDLYHQFTLLNDVFQRFSNKIQVGHIEDIHIYEHLLGYHFHIVHLKKYYESQTSYYIEIGIHEITKQEILEELIPILETYLNETLEVDSMNSPMNQLGYTYVVLKHKTKYYIQYGVSQCSKEMVACGDSYAIFTMDENHYFALSDGMGQGQKASEDSSLTLSVVRQLILNGISLKDTIQSVNALLKIKNRNDMFTTLDMIEINLVSAKATFIKYGACPTYILRNSHIIEIESKSLPIGIISHIDVSIQKDKLVENDIIIMVSDGFESPFRTFLKENEYLIKDEHPKDIVQLLMHLSSKEDNSDDMSIIALKICKQ